MGVVALLYTFHAVPSARASCLPCLHDAQATTGLTSVALFSMSGPGKVHLLCSVDALFLQACRAPSAASRFWGHAVTISHSRLNGFLLEHAHSLVPTANHLATCLCRTEERGRENHVERTWHSAEQTLLKPQASPGKEMTGDCYVTILATLLSAPALTS